MHKDRKTPCPGTARELTDASLKSVTAAVDVASMWEGPDIEGPPPPPPPPHTG
jgi:hypothetical protein